MYYCFGFFIRLLSSSFLICFLWLYSSYTSYTFASNTKHRVARAGARVSAADRARVTKELHSQMIADLTKFEGTDSLFVRQAQALPPEAAEIYHLMRKALPSRKEILPEPRTEQQRAIAEIQNTKNKQLQTMGLSRAFSSESQRVMESFGYAKTIDPRVLESVVFETALENKVPPEMAVFLARDFPKKLLESPIYVRAMRSGVPMGRSLRFAQTFKGRERFIESPIFEKYLADVGFEQAFYLARRFHPKLMDRKIFKYSQRILSKREVVRSFSLAETYSDDLLKYKGFRAPERHPRHGFITTENYSLSYELGKAQRHRENASASRIRRFIRNRRSRATTTSGGPASRLADTGGGAPTVVPEKAGTVARKRDSTRTTSEGREVRFDGTQ